MDLRLRERALAFAAVSSFAAAALTGASWEGRLEIPLVDGMALRAQESGHDSEAPGEGRTYQRIRSSGRAVVAEYGFQNFNRDFLKVGFQLPKDELEAYDAAWGYSNKDLDELRAAYERSRQGAYQFAVKSRKSQGQLDAAMSNLKKEHDKKVLDYMSSRGFRIAPGNMVEVDMPLLVRKNGPLLKPLALTFDGIATESRYDSESLMGSVASMVQTAVLYRIPPPVVGSRHTGGVLPPVKSLLVGWGDCDTKTGLLASVLANWPHMRMVGVALPRHYLMAVLRIPGKGQLFVEHEGLQYVLIEAAGPAWLPPGTVGRETLALLEGSEGYKIEPFF